jgi:hypothetical protein
MTDEMKKDETTGNKIEIQPLKPEDVEKAKKKGGLFGDPVLVIE